MSRSEFERSIVKLESKVKRAHSPVSLFELNKFFPYPCPIVGMLEVPITFVQILVDISYNFPHSLVVGFLVMIQNGGSVGETAQNVCYLKVTSIFGRLRAGEAY